jgi:dipeptidyl aminopeptidase/acylaminoacyl peptidase
MQKRTHNCTCADPKRFGVLVHVASVMDIVNGTVLRISAASLAFACLVTFSSESLARSQGKHRVTLNDLLSLEGIEYATLSPDGRLLAYTAYTPAQNVWVIATQGGESPRKLGEGFLPTWSPSGAHLAYYSGTSKTLQLWIYDTRTKRARQATHVSGGIKPEQWTSLNGWRYDSFRYAWSPDNSYLVFPTLAPSAPVRKDTRDVVSGKRGTASPLILTATTPPELTLRGIFAPGLSRQPGAEGYAAGRSKNGTGSQRRMANQLLIVDVRTHAIKQLTRDEATYFNPSWSPDGKSIACASSDGRSSEGRLTDTTNIYTIDVETHTKKPLTQGAGVKRLPAWAPDGRYIAYLADGLFKTQSVFVIPAIGGEPINVTSQLQRYVLAFAWSPTRESIIVDYQDGTADRIAEVDLAGSSITSIGSASNVARYSTTVAISRAGGLIWAQSDPVSEGVIHVLGARERESHVLINVNPQVNDWELGSQEVIRWRNNRGDALEGVLLKPVHYQEGRRYPLIVDAYPGQLNGFKGSAISGNQAWASLGYAVFWPNARAPHVWMNPYRSESFNQAAKGPKGWDITVDDVLSGVDEVINRGIVDANRICLYGFSNGGGIVNYLVTRTDRFKCAVSIAGALSDWLRPTLLRTSSMIPVFEGGLDPWHDPEAYIQLSAVFYAANVRTPMLLAVGDEDGDFVLDSIEMYNGLRRFGDHVTLLRYPNQGHGLTGDAMKDFWEREVAFFDRYLNPKSPSN